MKFSVRVNNDLSFDELLALAVAAELAGFDQLWVSNDLFLRSASVLAGALAARTARIGLGIAVMNPYSVHVSELAMVAATAAGDQRRPLPARPRRGLGAVPRLGRDHPGAAAGDDQVGAGRPARAARARGRRPDAAAGLVRSAERAQVPAGPPVPVYIGAMGPKMLEMAGRHADGVLPLLYPPERYASARLHVLAGLAQLARDFDFPACFWVSLSDDPVPASTALAEKLAYYGPSISASMLATPGCNRRTSPRPPGWRTAGRRRPSSSMTGCCRWASPGMPLTCWPAAGCSTGSAPGTCRSGRRSALTRSRRSGCSATRYCQRWASSAR